MKEENEAILTGIERVRHAVMQMSALGYQIDELDATVNAHGVAYLSVRLDPLADHIQVELKVAE